MNRKKFYKETYNIKLNSFKGILEVVKKDFLDAIPQNLRESFKLQKSKLDIINSSKKGK